MNKYASRFFRTDDLKRDNFIFDLPPHWWSRPYEYAWASKFAESDDIVLDAACGICHPLKFYLLDNCREVYACDIDKRILSPEEILKDIADDFGEETATYFPQKYLKNISYCQSSLTALPYEDKTFNKIYCISVLEHLDDIFNKYSKMIDMGVFNRLFSRDMYLSLKEFKRTLKDDGLIILTFDYPTVNLKYLKKLFRISSWFSRIVYLLRFRKMLYTPKRMDFIVSELF